MEQLGQFEAREVRGFFAPCGEMELHEAVALVDGAISQARSQGLSELLVDTTGLTGFPVPRLVERYLMGILWAESGGRAVALALVARAEQIDPQKFGVTVARNRGLHCDVFTSRSDAIAWLDRGCP